MQRGDLALYFITTSYSSIFLEHLDFISFKILGLIFQLESVFTVA